MVTCGLAMQDETDKIEIDQADEPRGVARRTVLRLGAVGVTAATVVTARPLWMPSLAQRGLLSADGAFAASSIALGDNLFYTE